MKQKVALVLSGGGARGMAHIGAIEELERQGFEITSIAGTSMGALIGGVYALGCVRSKETILGRPRGRKSAPCHAGEPSVAALCESAAGSLRRLRAFQPCQCVFGRKSGGVGADSLVTTGLKGLFQRAVLPGVFFSAYFFI